MNVYIYQAALLCTFCGEAKRLDLTARSMEPIDPDNESTYDSDTYPKGPYDNGGGEADSPQHCDSCHVFLQNPLTRDGVEYVREHVSRSPMQPVIREWLAFYADELSNPGDKP